MKLSDDLGSRGILLKAILFLVILLVSAVQLVIEPRYWVRGILVLTLSWSSARLYYFLFYVIEHYVDPEFHYSGLMSLLKYLWRKKQTSPPHAEQISREEA